MLLTTIRISLQLNTFAPNAFTGTPAQAITYLNTLPSTNRILVFTQQDLQSALPDGTMAIPDTTEDWLALLLYYAFNKTINIPNADKNRFKASHS